MKTEQSLEQQQICLLELQVERLKKEVKELKEQLAFARREQMRVISAAPENTCGFAQTNPFKT